MEWNSYFFGVMSGLLLAVLCDQLQRVVLGKPWQYTYTKPKKLPELLPPEPPKPPPAPAVPTGKTGRLVYDGQRNLGIHSFEWMKCVDCLSVYPLINGVASCNRTSISLCPWCRPDSRPNCYGRGN